MVIRLRISIFKKINGLIKYLFIILLGYSVIFLLVKNYFKQKCHLLLFNPSDAYIMLYLIIILFDYYFT